jgi:ATP-dependent helicase/nuclease subunit A
MEKSMQSQSSSVNKKDNFRSRFLQAGAGAGKTKTLIDTFVEFVQTYRHTHNGQFPKVMLTTFTRKATQEVKERLLRRVILENDPELFQFVSQKSRVHISTIHGILTLFLSQFGFYLDLPFDFKIKEQKFLNLVSRRSLKRILTANKEYLTLIEDYTFSELVQILDQWVLQCSFDQNFQAVNADFFRQQTLSYLHKFEQSAHELALLIRELSDNKTWLERAELLLKLQMSDESDKGIENFILHIARLEADLSWPRKDKRSVDLSIIEATTSFQEKYWDVLCDEKLQKAYLPQFWQAHDKKCQLFVELALDFKKKIDEEKIQGGFLSMADLELKAKEIIQKFPQTTSQFSKDWNFWMIDEYQDTSPMQVAILEAFVADRPEFVVGDPQQSIYYFRGARSEVFLQKKLLMEQKNSLVEIRKDNYRTRAPVLEMINDVFGRRAQFGLMDAKSSQHVDMIQPALDFRFLQANENDTHADTCAEAVIEKIQKLLSTGVQADKICVLAQKNSSLKSVFQLARKYKVPVQLRSAGGFYQRREILDVVSFLLFVVNPHDNINFVSLLRSPWFYLTDDDIAKLCFAEKNSYWASLPAPLLSQFESLKKLKSYLELHEKAGLLEALRTFYKFSGIMETSFYVDPSGGREANLWKFFAQLETAHRQAGFSSIEFLRDHAQDLNADEMATESEATPALLPKQVHLMTVHASKGLEFEHVIVTHLHQQRKAEQTQLFETLDDHTKLWTLAERDISGRKIGSLLSHRIHEQREIKLNEEHERLLYVAMTRAISSITLVTLQARSEKKTWLSLIPYERTDGVYNTDKFIYSVSTHKPELKMQESATKELKPARNAFLGTSTHKMPKVSATALTDFMEKSKNASTNTSAELLASRLKVAQRGTDAHRLFEALKFSSLEQLQKNIVDTTMLRGLDWISHLELPPMQQLIKVGFAEWGFVLAREQGILQGQIDLWANYDHQLWLVDYKTGSSANSNKALAQLKIYAWALRAMKETEFKSAQLLAVYPFEEKVIKQELQLNEALDDEIKHAISKYLAEYEVSKT